MQPKTTFKQLDQTLSAMNNVGHDLLGGSSICSMKVATGKVIDGKVVVEGAVLGEGVAVTILVPENDETFEVSATEESDLLRAIAAADRGDFATPEQVIESLRLHLT